MFSKLKFCENFDWLGRERLDWQIRSYRYAITINICIYYYIGIQAINWKKSPTTVTYTYCTCSYSTIILCTTVLRVHYNNTTVLTTVLRHDLFCVNWSRVVNTARYESHACIFFIFEQCSFFSAFGSTPQWKSWNHTHSAVYDDPQIYKIRPLV